MCKPMSFEYSKMCLNVIILHIANISLIDLPWSIPAAWGFSCSSFLSVQFSSHSPSPWSIVSWHTGRGRPEQHLSVANGPECQNGWTPTKTSPPKKTLSSIVEVIHASIDTLSTIEYTVENFHVKSLLS
jgi:hypothetical protein